MVAVKSLWVLLKGFSNNFSFKRDNGVRVPDHKPDKRIRYNRLRPQWHRPYYPSADPEIGGRSGSSGGFMNFSSKSYQDCLNGNCGAEGGEARPADYYNKDFDHFCDNSDSDYEDGDSDGEDFDDDFTTTDEDEDSDLDDEEDDGEEVLVCEVCERAFPTSKKLADHHEKKRHYGCPQCDSIFPSRKALDFLREQMYHLDYVSDYGTDDAASFGSGSVGIGIGSGKGISPSSSSSSSGVASGGSSCCGSSSPSSPSEENKCSVVSPTSNTTTTTTTNAIGAGNTTTGTHGHNCSGRRNNNNNNYHCYSNQLHASWYEGDDEEEKGLLRTN